MILFFSFFWFSKFPSFPYNPISWVSWLSWFPMFPRFLHAFLVTCTLVKSQDAKYRIHFFLQDILWFPSCACGILWWCSKIHLHPGPQTRTFFWVGTFWGRSKFDPGFVRAGIRCSKLEPRPGRAWMESLTRMPVS